jgi:antitoxin PrlF
MPGVIASKITARSQTTLPPGVRKVLGVGPGDRVGYVIEGFEVRLVNIEEHAHTDPTLAPFLALLGRDIADHPERLRGFPRELVARVRRLAAKVRIDHDAPLDGAVGL